jgi:hypothetical protein
MTNVSSNLGQGPTPSKPRTLKLHAIKYCIVDGKLHWKDPLGFLLCFLTES